MKLIIKIIAKTINTVKEHNCSNTRILTAIMATGHSVYIYKCITDDKDENAKHKNGLQYFKNMG